ncbi:MAG: CopD family protein [Sphingomonadaceae bacterium]
MNGAATLDWGTIGILTYEWIKAGHVIFVIFWIAGLFMLPRYFVYHQEAPPGSAEADKWIEREKKIRNIILTPSLILTWVLGLALAFLLDAWDQGWLHAKLFIVVLLSAYHGWAMVYAKKLRRGERPASGRTLRLLNEIPGIAVALIVVLVIVKPF